MPSNINLEPLQLAKYLQIAANQRKRALNKFITDYGPSSATVSEVQGEVAELDMAINQLVKDQAGKPKTK